MLAIRMQRTGRRGHAQFRLIVQESRRTPTSGRVVAQLGHYNPHTKEVVVDKEKAAFYLKNGAQPSERSARLLKSEGIKLPKWVGLPEPISRKTRNPEKLRKNQTPQPESVEKPEPDTEGKAGSEGQSGEEQPAASVAADNAAPTEEAAEAENKPDETQTGEAAADDSNSPTEEPAKDDAPDRQGAAEEPKKA